MQVNFFCINNPVFIIKLIKVNRNKPPLFCVLKNRNAYTAENSEEIKENSLEPCEFKRVALGGVVETKIDFGNTAVCY